MIGINSIKSKKIKIKIDYLWLYKRLIISNEKLLSKLSLLYGFIRNHSIIYFFISTDSVDIYLSSVLVE